MVVLSRVKMSQKKDSSCIRPMFGNPSVLPEAGRQHIYAIHSEVQRREPWLLTHLSSLSFPPAVVEPGALGELLSLPIQKVRGLDDFVPKYRLTICITVLIITTQANFWFHSRICFVDTSALFWQCADVAAYFELGKLQYLWEYTVEPHFGFWRLRK